MSPSSENQDHDTDTFEDARDTTQDSDTPGSNGVSRTRSLTDRPPSVGSLTTPKATKAPPLPITSPDEKGEDPSADDKDTSTGTNGDADEDTKKDANTDDSDSPEAQLEETPKKKKPPKSPLLTTHRLSTSSLDDVNLTGAKEEEVPSTAKSGASESPSSGQQAPPSRDSKQGSIFQGFSPSLPSVPWGSSSTNKSLPSQPQAPQSKKSGGPFSWLSRASTGQKDSKGSPTLTGARRNTGTSVSTLSSNPELLGRLQEATDGDVASIDSKRQVRNSLKDQFKLLRLRDEGGNLEEGAGASPEVEESRSSEVGSPSSKSEQPEAGQPSPSVTSPVATSPLPSTVNPNLAPGTVSGISAAASDASAPVNWELWQDIVNHGPEALRGANSEELNSAIRHGIPQTVRGVIWQILADSRNPGFEEVYHELSTRDPEKERSNTNFTVPVNGQTNGNQKEKESETSSRSSVRSQRSTPATSSVYDVPSPASTNEKDGENVAKAQEALEAVRKRKVKDEAVALQKLEKAIRRDLGSRTSYSKYFLSQRNQDGLFGLCKAYALYDEGVGYAQGMNFIVMPLLFNMDDGDAFCLLVKLMNQYGLRNLFIQDMPGLHLHLYQFERLLEDLEPALSCHLRRRGVEPQLYATQWFLTLFAYRFPLQLVLRIYDLIFGDGLEITLLRFAIAIMRRNSETLLQMNDMSSLTHFLKEKVFDVYIDRQPSASSILESGFFGQSGSDKEVYRADIMVEDACSITISPETIKTYSSEWEEKSRIEKEQAAEREGYINTTTTQAARIRVLEEHAEKSDKEHVQLASELVRLKVENEELRDANESYKVEVHELKSVIDKQPSEIEEKLKTEMDRIMKRNIEVQNESRAMEEQMADMEKELVQTKMKWAELCENHDNLKQKWGDLRKALDG